MTGTLNNTTATGTLFIIAAPSGAGKTSLVAALVDTVSHIDVSISHTTRPKRPNEIDGENYYFVNDEQFKKMAANNAFLEHACVFGNHYGTTQHFVQERVQHGTDVILEIDWQGAQQARTLIDNTVCIFILPPSTDALRQRLKKRDQDDPRIIEKRLAAAREEMSHHNEFEYLIINDDFDTALAELQAIVTSTRLRQPRCSQQHTSLITHLLAES